LPCDDAVRRVDVKLELKQTHDSRKGEERVMALVYYVRWMQTKSLLALFLSFFQWRALGKTSSKTGLN
jgi:hypothetical protein